MNCGSGAEAETSVHLNKSSVLKSLEIHHVDIMYFLMRTENNSHPHPHIWVPADFWLPNLCNKRHTVRARQNDAFSEPGRHWALGSLLGSSVQDIWGICLTL